MNLINLENITKSYSEKTLINNISLGINEGNKIGVIGINGTGKSTFLKIIAGKEYIDSGKIIKGNSVEIEYMPQNPKFDHDATVIEQIFKVDIPIMQLVKEYEEAISNPNTDSEKIIKLTNSMDSMNAWNIESQAKTILTKLGVNNFHDKIGNLSGGQKKRIALAAALITPCDLLVLDEPTNHLDNETIEWLEQYLNNRKGAIIMITHDRYFLDRVVNEIIEIDSGKLYSYKGNYSMYLQSKIEREELEKSNQKKAFSLYKKELSWIRRGAKARSTKQKARIDRFEILKDSIGDSNEQKFEISVANSRLGKKVIELSNVYKEYNNKIIIDNFNYIIQRDDRIGIVGPNGIGKSTLINILSGKLKQDSGVVSFGETVKIGLFNQENNYMDENSRVIEYIKEIAEYVTTSSGDKISASQMLERFLFDSTMQWTPIGKLSGGEKRRLQLLRVLMESPNVLLLDEPTNDLDVHTLAILEDYIENFAGVVIAVSHDRYFLNKISEKTFVFKKNGLIEQFNGNYDEFKERMKEESSKAIIEKKTKKEVSTNTKRVYKFSYNEQREFDGIDKIIEELEDSLMEKDEEIEKASSDYETLQKLLGEKEEIEKRLEEKIERWTYLTELAEKIKEQNK